MKLRVIQPGQPDATYEVAGPIATIGRAPGCDVVIRQPYVSKRHVVLMEGLVAIDLGSSNGTYISGERIEQATLITDGILRLGEDEVVIQMVDGVAPSTSPPTSEELRATLASVDEIESRVAERAREEREVPEDLPSKVARLEAEKREQDAIIRRLAEQVSRLEDAHSPGSSIADLLRENESLRERIGDLQKQNDVS